jgi:hypothetical protein
MSLENIQLPPIVLQELYKKTLIDSESVQSLTTFSQRKALTILGKNEKQIAIIVNNDEALYLPDEQLNFLLGILSACKLTLEDVAIINIKKNKKLSYTVLVNELRSEKIFLFGVEPSKIELPFQFPFYQMQQFNNQLYLSAPLLTKLQDDKAEKTKLWLCLKQIFSI